jgi:hypothetical protein
VQIIDLATAATVIAIADDRAGYGDQVIGMADLVLTVTEKVDPARFHLALIEPNSEVDRAVLVKLKADDEKLLDRQLEKFLLVLETKLQDSAKGRKPAEFSNLNMRLQSLKATKWRYPN